jgi:acyl-CoA thioester hydrolase
VFELDFRVDYIDTDAMGVVHHSKYCRWLERARVRWLESMGLNYREMESEGYALPLRALRLEYLKPLRFDDAARIKLKVSQLSRVRVDIEYEIWAGENLGVLVSRAVTEHVLVKNMKPCSIPDVWRNKWLQQNEQK